MSLKQALIEAAKHIDTAVELDSIFESVELSTDVKSKFQTVFESAVKSQAVKLAETHITAIADKAEEMVEAKVQEEIKDLSETVDGYLDHVAGQWMSENAAAVASTLKVEMFDSLMVGMKDLFVEHNVVLPEEGVAVVEELESEISEAREELNIAISNNVELNKQLNSVKRDVVVESAIANLTESQKEKVKTLIEGIDYSPAFQGKLAAIVEMTAAVRVVESTKPEETPDVALVVEEEVNFTTEEPKAPVVDNVMAAYLAAL